MNRLLIAYDGSDRADGAIHELIHAGLPDTGEALVLSVADVWLPPETTPDTSLTPPGARKARERAREAVKVAQQTAETGAAVVRSLFPKWIVTGEAVPDSPAWALLRKAEKWNADLVVVGSHSRSTLERFFLGSVSQKVLAEARCSVRIARERRHRTEHGIRNVVAVDGSAESEAAVRVVAARQWPVSAAFRLLTVIDPKIEAVAAWPSVYASQWVQQNDAEAREWVCRVVEHHAKVLADAGLSVETDIFDGDAKKVLVKFAEDWEADAIYLGARGLHHGDRHLLGTTASAVATHAHCSVEVIRAS